MHLDRHLADAELAGDLLVQPSGNHQQQDLALARGQHVEPAAQLSEPQLVGAAYAILFQRDPDRIEQIISDQLEKTPYILGDEFSAADILYCSFIQFFKGTLFPARKHYDDYVARLTARPAYARAQARDNG